MSAAVFASSVAALLVGDAIFQAEIAALIGVPVTRVLKSNQQVATIGADQVPCFLLEHAPGASGSIANDGGDIDGLVIGHSRQGFNSELDVALIWTNPDRESAFDQCGELPTLFAQLFMRNPQPGGTGLVYLAGWLPGQSIHHPRQVWTGTLAGQYAIYRS